MKQMKQVSVLLLLMTAGLLSCSDKKGKGSQAATAPPIAVMVAQVTATSSVSDVNISGNIEGNTTVRIGFMVGGKIDHIAFSEGQPVRKGQLVASLDQANYRLAKEAADIQVKQVTDEYNRLSIMHDRNSISESDFKKIGFTLDQARTQQKMQAQNLEYTTLYAPINGVLLKKLAEAGEITGVGNPVLVISDISKVKVNAFLPENQLSVVKIGQTAKVMIPSLSTDAYEGKIVEVGSAADATTRAFSIKVEVPNPKLLIRPGMIAEVDLPGKAASAAIAVPGNAVLRTPDGQPYVYVADMQKQIAVKRNVSIGAVNNNLIVILSGLEAGETIVTGGQQKLTNGAAISITK